MHDNVWRCMDDVRERELNELCDRYRVFISENKTERECCAASIELARASGYVSFDEFVAQGRCPVAGDKVYRSNRNKALLLINIGKQPLSGGMNILGAHIDSPRLDVKQNPLYESDGLAYIDTHYYGGLKPSLWVATPLAIHGVICKKDGTCIKVVVGEDPNDPVFSISDLLIHLAKDQMEKPFKEAVPAENLDLIVGGRPSRDDVCTCGATDEGHSGKETGVGKGDAQDGGDRKKDAVKNCILKILSERYDVQEDDLLSAELEIVPAGCARDMGFDRSMILGYGHDDRVCAFVSLMAQLDVESVERTSVCLLVDKEEIGSVGATGMHSFFFENTIAELMALSGNDSMLDLRRALEHSHMLSSDVAAGYDPSYPDSFERKNSAFLGCGLCLIKFTGRRGKAGSNDADAEYVARIRAIMHEANVVFQTCELGRVNAGGGGTIAFIPAQYGMNVIDAGVPTLSMHSLWEVVNKADVYEAYRGYKAFLQHA